MSTSEEYELLAESMDVVRAQRNAARRLLAEAQAEVAVLKDALHVWDISPFVIKADVAAEVMKLPVRLTDDGVGTSLHEYVKRSEVLDLLK